MRPVEFDSPAAPRQRPRVPAPLLLPAVGLMLGILCDAWLPLPRAVLALLAADGVVLALFAWQLRIGRAASVLMLAFALGAVRHDLALRHWPADHLVHRTGANSVLATIRGTLVDAPRVDPGLVGPDRPPNAAEPRTRFTLAAEALIDTANTTHDASGRVAVSVTGDFSTLRPGDHIEIFGWLGRPTGPRNLGAVNWRLWYARNGVLVTLHANQPEALNRLGAAPRTLASRALDGLRRFLSRALRDTGEGEMDDSLGSLLDALVLAQRGRVERAIDEAFLRTGNSHLLAASGMNVAWLVALVWLPALLLGWHSRTTALLAIGVIAIYAVIAEPNPPILRAAVTGLLGLGALLLRRTASGVNWLSAAASFILLANPTHLFTASFQLSFVCVLGLILVSPATGDTIVGMIRLLLGRAAPPDEPENRWSRGIFLRDDRAWRSPLNFAYLASVLSITAWLVAAPLVVYHFHQFTFLAPLTTLLLAVPAFLAIALGFIKLLLVIPLPQSAAWIGPPLEFVTDAMVRLATLLSRIPGVNLTTRPVSLLWVVVCYGLLALWLVFRRRGDAPPRPLRSGWHRVALMAAAIAWAAWPLVGFAAPRRTSRATIWTLAVGNGTATIIEWPDGRVFLYDCGSRTPRDVARSAVVPFLESRGIRRIDAAFISHPDSDHYNALLGVHRAVPVGRVVVSDRFREFAAEDPGGSAFLAAVADAAIPLDTISAGWRDTAGGSSIEMLWPPAPPAFLPNDNGSSMVLRLNHAGRTMLLTGDADEYALRALLDAAPSLACDVLHLPHHGAMTRETAEFVERTLAATFIRSAGERDAETLNGMVELMTGRRYLNTADVGCVRTILDASGAPCDAPCAD